jgi:hypothetical protein
MIANLADALLVIKEQQKQLEDLRAAPVSNSRLIDGLNAEKLAEKFHTLYEGFAPEYGYKTRDESSVPWKDVPEQNKKLMIRVCKIILGSI